MSDGLLWLLVGVSLGWGLLGWWARRQAFRRFADRPCAGMLWHRAFRSAPPSEIRGFLHGFARAFGFSDRQALRFRPDDRLWEIYAADQALYLTDTMQLETLHAMLTEDYRVEVDLNDADLTLGELFTATRRDAL